MLNFVLSALLLLIVEGVKEAAGVLVFSLLKGRRLVKTLGD